MRVLQVAWNQSPKSFLACCIPQLESIGLIIMNNISDKEVDANSSLD